MVGLGMSVAIVHDWLPVFSGAEQVVSSIMKTTGPTDLYTLFNFLSDEDMLRIGASRIITSYLDRWPLRQSYYRYTFPFCPAAIESFDLSGYDLILSSSAAFAKGVIVHPHQRHIAYVHTPARYAWDQTFEYMRRSPLARGPFGAVLRHSLHQLRVWDVRSAQGPDIYLANSSSVQRRIEQIYGRSSFVLHPPVDVTAFPLREEKDDYFVVATRLVPYKRVDLVVSAFNQMPNRKLVVCGDGPELNALKAMAGTNIEFTGHMPRKDLIEKISRAQAFIFAAYEDFGIVMAEAQAAGTPVIAYHLGGARDIVVPLGNSGPTGVLFREQSTTSLKTAVDEFVQFKEQITAENCHRQAQRFGSKVFEKKLARIIEQVSDSGFQRSIKLDF